MFHCIVIFHSNSPYAYLKHFLSSGYVMDAITTNAAGIECLLPASRYQPFR